MSETAFSYDVGIETFQSIVLDNSMQVPVLVDFWASWCAPCQTLKPMLEQLAEEYQGGFILAKVDSDQQQELAAQFGVRSLPTVKLFRNGEVVDEFMGALPEPQLREFIDKHLVRQDNPLHAQAVEAYEAGEYERAEELLREANAQDPKDIAVHKDMARVLAAKGDIDGAREILASLPLEEREGGEVKGLLAQIELLKEADTLPDVESLNATLAADPTNSEANYQLALYQILGSDFESAFDILIGIMRRDRAYGDDAARKRLVALFEMLGDEEPLVREYRRKMFQALY